jgi:hypothetical protein
MPCTIKTEYLNMIFCKDETLAATKKQQKTHSSKKDHFLHLQKSAKKLKSTRVCSGLVIIYQHLGSIWQPCITPVTPFSTAVAASSINGKVRLKPNQAVSRQTIFIIHHCKLGASSVLGQQHQKTSKSQLYFNLGEFFEFHYS